MVILRVPNQEDGQSKQSFIAAYRTMCYLVSVTDHSSFLCSVLIPRSHLATAGVGEEASAAEFISVHSGVTTHSTTESEHFTFKAGCSEVHGKEMCCTTSRSITKP